MVITENMLTIKIGSDFMNIFKDFYFKGKILNPQKQSLSAFTKRYLSGNIYGAPL